MVFVFGRVWICEAKKQKKGNLQIWTACEYDSFCKAWAFPRSSITHNFYRSKKLLGAPGIASRSTDATNGAPGLTKT